MSVKDRVLGKHARARRSGWWSRRWRHGQRGHLSEDAKPQVQPGSRRLSAKSPSCSTTRSAGSCRTWLCLHGPEPLHVKNSDPFGHNTKIDPLVNSPVEFHSARRR